MRFLLIFILLFVFSFTEGFSQASDIEIAENYAATGECEIAIVYYEKIIKTNRTRKVYDNYKKCLVETQRYDDAIKLVKSFIKKSSNNALYQVDLGQLYLLIGDTEKANKTFQSAIKDLKPSQYQVISMANSFIKMNQLDFAYDTYIKGRKELDGKYTFHYELATLEGIRGNIP